jgi:hypothetical protein
MKSDICDALSIIQRGKIKKCKVFNSTCLHENVNIWRIILSGGLL